MLPRTGMESGDKPISLWSCWGNRIEVGKKAFFQICLVSMHDCLLSQWFLETPKCYLCGIFFVSFLEYLILFTHLFIGEFNYCVSIEDPKQGVKVCGRWQFRAFKELRRLGESRVYRQSQHGVTSVKGLCWREKDLDRRQPPRWMGWESSNGLQ